MKTNDYDFGENRTQNDAIKNDTLKPLKTPETSGENKEKRPTKQWANMRTNDYDFGEKSDLK